jgi:hypothetical protein
MYKYKISRQHSLINDTLGGSNIHFHRFKGSSYLCDINFKPYGVNAVGVKIVTLIRKILWGHLGAINPFPFIL